MSHTVVFRKSSFSTLQCVEAAVLDGQIVVRHSRATGEALTFSRSEWSAFVAGVKAGEFDFDS